jgi:hypothetical protein
MNIVEQAEADLSFTLEDKDSGCGISVVLIDTSGVRYGENDELIVQSTDIGFSIDPQTGVNMEGGTSEINLRLTTLLSVVGVLPAKGWKAELNHPTENITRTYELRDKFVDRKIGIFKMALTLVDTA